MYYISEFCYVCMQCEKKLCRLSDIGANNITYYRMLRSVLPELNKETISQFRYICEGCSRLLDDVYTFHKRCLTNIHIFEHYLLLLRSASNVSAELTVVLNDVKNNTKALSSPEDASDFNRKDIHADIDSEKNNISHMEDTEVKNKVDGIKLYIVKRELPFNEACTSMEDNETNPDIKLLGQMEDVEVKKDADDITSDIVKHDLPLNEIKYEVCTDMEDNNRSPDLPGQMEDVEVKKEADDITSDIVKHELPLDEIKYEVCIDMEDNNRSPDLPEKMLIPPIWEKSEIIDHVCDKQTQTNEEQHQEQAGNSSRHLRTDIAEKPFESEICPKKLKSEKLSLHVQNHREEIRYKIETIHTGEKPFECNICKKRFSQSSVLIVHKRIHTGEKPFECNICEKRFSRNGDLTVHKRIHTREKLFECNMCERRFNHSSNLNAHKRIHTGEKIFECNICEKRFSRNADLTVHKRTHTGEKPFQCNVCEKRFVQSGHLITHKQVHSEEKPFECNVCQRKFSVNEHLTKHLLVHTKKTT